MTDRKLWPYFAIAVALQVVWGLVPSASKFVIEEIPVELYIALRWTLSGAIFALYLVLTSGWRRVRGRDFAAVALLGLLGYGVASLGSLYGLKIGGVANFALMSALGPVATSTVAIFVLRERPRRRFYLALPLSVLGLILLVGGRAQIASFTSTLAAAGCILGGAFLEALVFVFSKHFRERIPTAQYLAMAQLAAAAGLWVAQVAHLHQIEQLHQLSGRGIGAALFVSLVACVLCYAVLYWLLNHVDGHRLALFDGVHALSATAFGAFFFAEKLTLLMAVGGLFILAGLVSGTSGRPQKTPE